MVDLVTEAEVVVVVLLVPDTDPLRHGVREGEIGEAVEEDDCQDHCMVSFAALVLDLAHAVGEGWGHGEVPAGHMDSAAEVVG